MPSSARPTTRSGASSRHPRRLPPPLALSTSSGTTSSTARPSRHRRRRSRALRRCPRSSNRTGCTSRLGESWAAPGWGAERRPGTRPCGLSILRASLLLPLPHRLRMLSCAWTAGLSCVGGEIDVDQGEVVSERESMDRLGGRWASWMMRLLGPGVEEEAEYPGGALSGAFGRQRLKELYSCY